MQIWAQWRRSQLWQLRYGRRVGTAHLLLPKCCRETAKWRARNDAGWLHPFVEFPVLRSLIHGQTFAGVRSLRNLLEKSSILIPERTWLPLPEEQVVPTSNLQSSINQQDPRVENWKSWKNDEYSRHCHPYHRSEAWTSQWLLQMQTMQINCARSWVAV